MSAFRLSELMHGDMTHITYKGEAPLIQDLIGGNIPMSFASGAVAGQFIATGKLKAIGVLGPKRIASMPEVPTLSEAGFDDPLLRAVGWVGVAAPAGTPKPLVDRLAQAVEAWVATPAAQKRIHDVGWSLAYQGPAEFTETYKREAPVWEAAVKQSGATIE